MKIIATILFSIIGVLACAQKTDPKDEFSIYCKGCSWFAKPAEYKTSQEMYQNNQAIYCCEFNSDSLMTGYEVYFETGQIAVQAKAIEIKKVYPSSDSVFYFISLKYQEITFYQDGKIRSIEINTNDIESFEAFNRKGKIIFKELTIDEKHYDGLILTDMNSSEMILNYYKKGILKAIVKTDYVFNITEISKQQKLNFFIRRKIIKINKFKFQC